LHTSVDQSDGLERTLQKDEKYDSQTIELVDKHKSKKNAARV